MINTEQDCPEVNVQKSVTGGESVGILSNATPLAIQGITGAGFVLIDYRPPEKSPGHRFISSQYRTGDHIS